MPMTDLEKTDFLESPRRYLVHFERRAGMGSCSDGPFAKDMIQITDTETSEQFGLYFRRSTKKLVNTHYSAGTLYLSYKQISPENGSQAAYWKQRSNEGDLMHFHEMTFDDNGVLTEDVHTDKQCKSYFNFLDEQKFMLVLRDALTGRDDPELSAELQQTKHDILDYLNHNIAAPPSDEKPFVS